MAIRMALVAGQFYESSPELCRGQIEQMLPSEPICGPLPRKVISAIVPHAGWVFSGELAAMAFAAIKQQKQHVDTFVIFGAVHSVRKNVAMVYNAGQWGTPLGRIDVDEQLAFAIINNAKELVVPDCQAHSREHSIEVQVPIIQYLFGDAKIVPIMVPPTERSADVGVEIAKIVSAGDKEVVFIGSTDLTHYGPSYFCTPHGTGPEALRWAKDSNDRYFINTAVEMQAEKLVDAAETYNSACGAGAAAAAVAAAKQLGSQQGYLLGHSTSSEIMAKRFRQQSDDSVGYATILFG